MPLAERMTAPPVMRSSAFDSSTLSTNSSLRKCAAPPWWPINAWVSSSSSSICLKVISVAAVAIGESTNTESLGMRPCRVRSASR